VLGEDNVSRLQHPLAVAQRIGPMGKAARRRGVGHTCMLKRNHPFRSDIG